MQLKLQMVLILNLYTMSLNLTKIQNGFILNSVEYILDSSTEVDIISENQVHIPTDKGVVLLDTSVTIDGNSFETIELFIQALTNEA